MTTPATVSKLARSPAKSASRYSISPLSLVQEGNSDPFSVFAIPIDRHVNELMKYTRDVYLPGIQGDLNNPGSPAVQREWTECVTFLQDECLASAHFTRIASIVASDTDHQDSNHIFQTQALVLKSKTMTILRQRLIQSIYDASACNTILMLLNEELYARDLEAAKVHAVVLARLLQSDFVTTDPTFLFKILYHDAQRAVMSLSRTSFDFEDWIPAKFNPIFIGPIQEHLPYDISPEKLSEDIDPSMDEFPVMKNIIIGLKHCLLLSLLGFKDPKYATLPIVMYGRVSATMAMGRLVNYYLDAVKVSKYVVDSDHRTQAYISLATLLWMRAISRIDNVRIAGNTRIFAANEFILETLTRMLKSEELNTKNSNIRLWVLYTSACIELSLGKTNAQDSWLVNRFLRQASEMNLSSWAEVKDILQSFLFTEMLPPNGSTWSQMLDDR